MTHKNFCSPLNKNLIITNRVSVNKHLYRTIVLTSTGTCIYKHVCSLTLEELIILLLSTIVIYIFQLILSVLLYIDCCRCFHTKYLLQMHIFQYITYCYFYINIEVGATSTFYLFDRNYLVLVEVLTLREFNSHLRISIHNSMDAWLDLLI